ncbi:MAG: hypothetical protein JNN00_07440 [Chitinophagaceae bacterium]|nr:hypothetical protein [Chitinophagaceae bacterium]
MIKITFFLFLQILSAYPRISHAQISEIKEFQQKKTKIFVSRGEGKSEGLNFSIQYPASYEVSDINAPGVVKGFSNTITGVLFMIAILRHEDEASPEAKRYVLSKENLEKTMKAVSSSAEFIAYKNDFKTTGFPSAYIEFKTSFSDELNTFYRNYAIEVANYSVILSFIVPLEKKINATESKVKFNSYNSFFNVIVNSFKPVNVKKTERDDSFDLKEYLEYKDRVPDTDNTKTDETWINDLYRNKKYKFRIVFPKNWEYDGGTSKRTLARALNREKAASIAVTVTHVDPIKNKDSNNIYKIPSMTKDQMNQVLELQNMKVYNFKCEKGYLNNFPAYLYEFTTQQSSGTESYTYLSKQVQCLCGNKLYTLVINLPLENWDNEMIIQFDRVVKSFTFEIAF